MGLDHSSSAASLTPRPAGALPWWITGPLGGAHTASWIYLVLELLPAAIFSPGYFGWPEDGGRSGRRPRPLVVDDDVYWRKGWYENPNDPRWLVQDRLVPYNYSMNMAKPGAWGGTIAPVGGGGDPPGGAVRPLSLGGFWRLLGVHHLSEQVACLPFSTTRRWPPRHPVRHPSEALPEDEYVRTNGLDDGRRLIGHFPQSGRPAL